jgi:hypothetical protein
MSTNSLTSTGITIQDLASILDELKNGTTDFPGLYAIYGTDINLEPNSPDGQLINLIAQAKIDILEFIVQDYNSFNPDTSVGTALDFRCAINGITRAGGTYTQQNVEVTVDRALTLAGLDTSPTSPFVVRDTADNQYNLISTAALLTAGTHTLVFQAAEPGPVSSALNTINEVVTVTLGVTAVNNIATATTTGIAQETDSALRIRRARSVSIPSKGYLDGLIGSLLDLEGVTQVEVFENVTNVTDTRDIPGHSIWVIVSGGSASDIAQVIYVKRSLGCGMKGVTVVPITQADGLVLDIKFDRAIPQELWIRFNVEAMTGIIDLDYLRTQLLAQLSYNINEMADSSQVVQLAKNIYPNASISEDGVSVDGINYFSLVAPSTVQNQFVVAQIEINGTVS